ncbi:hypothetical protein SNEBB_003272 [Seison nebaliae]|nr:hypothetical protein SNEBB_003272 [Seison nebaliae]
MFILSEIEDVIKIHPWQLSKESYGLLVDGKDNDDFPQIIISLLEDIYTNKIIHNVGLCCAVNELIHIGTPVILPALTATTHENFEGGTVTIITKFDVVVLRPLMNEILYGRVKSSEENGIRISLDGIFDEIFIPENHLMEPAKFNTNTRTWSWLYGDEDDDENADVQLTIDIGQYLRFRVINEIFNESKNKTKSSDEPDQIKNFYDYYKTKSAYMIIGSINEDGLGPLSWWKESEEEKKYDDEDDDDDVSMESGDNVSSNESNDEDEDELKEKRKVEPVVEKDDDNSSTHSEEPENENLLQLGGDVDGDSEDNDDDDDEDNEYDFY